MSYNELIGIVGETNRPPGGNASIYEIARRVFLNEKSTVLEVGTSTGSAALELNRLTGCVVVAIDINETSLDMARNRAKLLGIEKVRFEKADAMDMPYRDNTFDLTFCGNVTSLVERKEQALAEYSRVTRNGGYIAAIPMYYVKEPPNQIVERVQEAIKASIEVRYREDAVRFFKSPGLEVYECIHYLFDDIPESQICSYVDLVLSQEHLKALSADIFRALREVYLEYMLLFWENLKYMGHTILILRKAAFIEEPILFSSHRI